MESIIRALMPACFVPHEQRDMEQEPEPPILLLCAWCGRTMREGIGPPSHGMCAECERKS